jgi:ketosteroid isomerase-like protein
MNKLIRYVVGIAIPAFIMAGAVANSAAAQQLSDMDAVKAANESFYTALSARDVGTMEKVWSSNKDNRNISPRNKTIDVGWDAAKKTFQATFDAFTELKVSPEQIYVRINGSTAWVSNMEMVQRKTKTGEAGSGTNFGLNIFEKQGGKWLMVYHQASPVPR